VFEAQYAPNIASPLPSATPLDNLYSAGSLAKNALFSSTPPAPEANAPGGGKSIGGRERRGRWRASDGGAMAVIEAYHAGPVPPVCLSAVKSFFDGF
jgi:hypothetical protein